MWKTIFEVLGLSSGRELLGKLGWGVISGGAGSVAKGAMSMIGEAFGEFNDYVLHDQAKLDEVKELSRKDASGIEERSQADLEKATAQSKKLGDDYAAKRDEAKASQYVQDQLSDSEVASRVAQSKLKRQQELGNAIGNPDEQARINLEGDKDEAGIESAGAVDKAARDWSRAADAERENTEHIGVIEKQKDVLRAPMVAAGQRLEEANQEISRLGIKSDEQKAREELAETQRWLNNFENSGSDAQEVQSIENVKQRALARKLEGEIKKAQGRPPTYTKARQEAEDTLRSRNSNEPEVEQSKSKIRALDKVPVLREAVKDATEAYREGVAPLEAQEKKLKAMQPLLVDQTKIARQLYETSLTTSKASGIELKNREKALTQEKNIATARRTNQTSTDPNLAAGQVAIGKDGLAKSPLQPFNASQSPGRDAPGMPGAPSQQSQSGSQDQGQEAITQAVSAIKENPVAKHMQALRDALTTTNQQVVTILTGLVAQIKQMEKDLNQIKSQNSNDTSR